MSTGRTESRFNSVKMASLCLANNRSTWPPEGPEVTDAIDDTDAIIIAVVVIEAVEVKLEDFKKNDDGRLKTLVAEQSSKIYRKERRRKMFGGKELSFKMIKK